MRIIVSSAFRALRAVKLISKSTLALCMIHFKDYLMFAQFGFAYSINGVSRFHSRNIVWRVFDVTVFIFN